MTYCGTVTRVISVQEKVLHELAKIFWGTLELGEMHNEESCLFCKKNALVTHRDAVLKNLPQNICDISKQFSSSFFKLHLSKIINAVFNLQQGYYEALLWEKKYRSSLPFNILNPVTAGKYHASYFIEPTGHFNDFAWVKLFVIDGNLCACSRFKMSSLYCLEDILYNIYNKLESGMRCPFEISFSTDSPVAHDPVIFFWAGKAAKYFEESAVDIEKKFNEMSCAMLPLAIFIGHEYAVRYFYDRCSVSEKDNFLENLNYYSIIKAADENLSGIVHFLYFILSQEHKSIHVFKENLQLHGSMGKILNSMLNSKFFECTLNDILNFCGSIPISVYLDIFNGLMWDIEEFNHPIKKMIFKKLWNHLSIEERTNILEMNSSIISIFLSIKETDLLEAIIRPLSITFKDMLLLHDLQGAGKSTLIKLSNAADDEAMHHYLILFLVNKNYLTQNFYIRSNASGILEHLKKDIEFNSSEVCDLAKQRIYKNINSLNDCLNLLDDVLTTI